MAWKPWCLSHLYGQVSSVLILAGSKILMEEALLTYAPTNPGKNTALSGPVCVVSVT